MMILLFRVFYVHDDLKVESKEELGDMYSTLR